MDGAILKTNDLLRDIAAQLSEINRKSADNTNFTRRKELLYGIEAGTHMTRLERQRFMVFSVTIRNVLGEFGIHTCNKGYVLMIEAVKIIYDLNTIDISFSNDIYPYIALKYGLSGQKAVGHSIRNAIKAAYRDHQRQPGCNRMSIFGYRPANKEFVLYVADEVWKRMSEQVD